MRVATIRGDLPAPIRLSGLEPISQYNPDIEPVGQELYLARPSETRITTALATVPASIQSTGAITFPLVINGANQTLKLRLLATDAYTSITVPATTYNTIAELAAGVNVGIGTSGFAAQAFVGTVANTLQLRTSTSLGVGARLQIDSTAGGSTFNTPAVFAAGGTTFTLASAATIIAGTVPVGGPVNVSNATLLPLVGPGLSGASLANFIDLLAPRVFQTSVVEDSLKTGDLAKLLSVTYTPNPVTLPMGPAIRIVEDDGVTPFVAPVVPVIAGAVLAGSLTISGNGLGDSEAEESIVTLLGAGAKKLYQRTIVQAGGSVSNNTIVIPPSLLTDVAVTTSSVKVQFRSFMSNTQVVAL